MKTSSLTGQGLTNPPDAAPDYRSPNVWQALGLASGERGTLIADFEGQQRQLAAIWPFTLAVQLFAAVVAMLTAFLA